jgi:hypothetical protein
MLNIPPDLLGRFVAVLEERGLPPTQHSYYRKWLRYYLDFCDKYRVEATSPKSQAQLLDKLREKKQAGWQIKQAAHAVSLYWNVQRGLKARPTASVAGPLSKAAEGAKAHRLQPELPKKQLARKEKESQIPPMAQSPWDRAISQLVAVIKTRHYSPKTLKSYNHWARKLQSFKKDSEPSALTCEDVKEFLTYLAVQCRVSASSQNQAFNALLLFFRHGLQEDFGEIRDVKGRSVNGEKLPSPFCPLLPREGRIVAGLPPTRGGGNAGIVLESRLT